MYSSFDASGDSRQQMNGYFQPQNQELPQQYNQGGPNIAGFNAQQNIPNSFNDGAQFSNVKAQGLDGSTGLNSTLNPTVTNGVNNNMANLQQNGSFFANSQAPTAFSGPANGGSSVNMPTANRSSFSSGNYQSQSLQPQSTGYYNVPFQQPQLQQPQQTGFQQQTQQGGFQQPQTQQTGFQPQMQPQAHQQSQQNGLQQQNTGYGQIQASQQPLLPQQTGFYLQNSQVPMEPLKPNATGFVNSFANNGINNDLKIPVRRLSFITANDQAKFERLFRSMVPKGSNTISGNDCRKILMKSGLQASQLAKIWSLCDSSRAGELLFPEFALAMHLVNTVLQGDSIPYELDTKSKNEVSGFIDAINLTIASESSTNVSEYQTPFDNMLKSGFANIQPQGTGFMPQTSFGIPLQSQNTGTGFLNPQSTGFMPQTSFGIPAQMTGGGLPVSRASTVGLQPQNTGFMPQTSFNAPLIAQTTGSFTQGNPNQIGGNISMLQGQTTGGYGGSFQNQATSNFSTLQPQNTGGFGQGGQNQFTGNFSSLQPQTTGSFGSSQQPRPMSFNSMVQPQSTGNALQAQTTGGFGSMLGPQSINNAAQQQSQVTGTVSAVSGSQPSLNMPLQPTGTFMSNIQPQSGSAGNTQQIQTAGNMIPLQNQQTGFLPPSGFNPTVPLTAQKTGFGNNEIYSQSNFGGDFTANNEDFITDEEKSLFYKIFETYDTQNRGLLEASSAVEIFRKSGLNRGDLEKIWSLCDINNNGQLNKQEFALGMHLVYRKLNGFQLPYRLPLNLIPSSRKILDNVKNQLKSMRVEDDKKTATKTDALSYKNNDDEDILPSFRNRRKVFQNSTKSASSANSEAASKSVSNSVPKPASNEESLNTHKNKNRERAEELKRAILDGRNRLKIEQARAKPASRDDLERIQSLKQQIMGLQKVRNVENAAVPTDIKTKFDSVMLKLPDVFSQITEVDSAISNAKIELFRLKNPSSLVGTGPNGEITDSDRKKAKSKALLKSRMDALTGKSSSPSESFEAKEAQYNAEIAQIKSEGAKNQEIITDIRRSIAEISASLISSLNGGRFNNSPEEFEKWEFGAGLEPDIQTFISELKLTDKSAFSSPTSSSGNPTISKVNSSSQLQVNEPTRVSTSNISHTTSNCETVSRVNNIDLNEDDAADGDVDAEERQLEEELKRLKLKKKEEKQKRLAQLRRQIEEAQEESSGEEEWQDHSLVNKGLENHKVEPPLSNVPSHASVVPPNQPRTPLSAVGTGGANPFFKHGVSTASSFDLKAAETQRRLQRGLDHDDDDDGWADDEPKKQEPQPGSTNMPPNTVRESQESKTQMSAPTAPVVPLAPPPLPSLNVDAALAASPVANVQPAPVPIATPVLQVDVPAANIPVPLAPPIPQIHSQNDSESSFMGPPPALPSTGQMELQDRNKEENDSDDVLSIPDSVASEEHVAPPSGIPPPPPLPSM